MMRKRPGLGPRLRRGEGAAEAREIEEELSRFIGRIVAIRPARPAQGESLRAGTQLVRQAERGARAL
jgi:hypothetical protein